MLQPAGRWLERSVGVVALLLGTLLSLGTLFGAYSMLSKPVTTVAAAAIAVLILVLLSAFLVVAGLRLLRGVSKARSALFSPAVWFIVSGAMLCLGVFFVIALVPKSAAEGGQAVTLSLLLALLSFGAGVHFRRKAHGQRAA